jgi:hypothetical protein
MILLRFSLSVDFQFVGTPGETDQISSRVHATSYQMQMHPLSDADAHLIGWTSRFSTVEAGPQALVMTTLMTSPSSHRSWMAATDKFFL